MSYESLVSAAADKRLLVVCGAGVTAATAPSSPFGSWFGLIEHGLKTVCEQDAAEQNWVKVANQMIEAATHPSDLIMISDGIQHRMGNKFGKWLRETVGTLEMEDPKLVEAIGRLNAPIATTNYDTLIEKVLNRRGITWQDPAMMQLALTGELSDVVMYLHGRWLNQDSVIFGAGSYGNISGNGPAQYIQELLAGSKSMLFVGVGDTLRDPNIGTLLKRVGELVPNSQNQHYLLCRSGQLQDMVTLYKETSIVPVSFGDEFPELADFVNTLAKEAVPTAALSLPNHHKSARLLVFEGILNKSLVLSDAQPQGSDISTLLIPPILLPAPHEEIVSGLDSYEPGQRLRCDPAGEATSPTPLLVVGDETSGVTTALEWLTLTRTESDSTLIPVVIDYRNLTTGSRTVERLVRRTLASGGITLGVHDNLPKIVLAVDNVTPGTKRFETLVAELREEWVGFFYLGCRNGIEQEIIEALEAVGISDINTRYLGQVTRKDTLKLTRLAVGDTRAEQLAETIYRILESENLARTPWTIGLLLKIFVRTSITIKSISPTNLLDLFMNSLLGPEDNTLEDSRISIDARGREAILGALAETYCRKRVGALPESEVIDQFEKLFARWGWNESPTAVLTDLKSRHVLSTSLGDAKTLVKFAQSSYLFLFAAKRASEDLDFRKFLLSKPLVYSPVLTHYAALVRNDADLLQEAYSLVCSTNGPAQNAKIFGTRTDDSSDLSPAITRLIELADRSDGAKDAPEAAGHGEAADANSASTDGTDHVEYLLDHALSGDIEPFPVDDIDDGPDTFRALTALNLVSNVLRDSELVPDPELKGKTLSATLTLWAYWVSMLETDSGFTEICTRMADALCTVSKANESKRAEVTHLIVTEMPLLAAATSMNSALASRKLDIPLQLCLKQALDVGNLPLAAMAVVLAVGSQSPSWTQNFHDLAKRHSGKETVFDVLVKIARLQYVQGSPNSTQMKDIESFLTTIIMKNSNSNSTLSKSKANKAVEGLRKSRALHKAKVRGQISDAKTPELAATNADA
ncbi:SIR2 family protein [Mycobacteroides abscessus]|uniref:SIR2 family protein n=3 Tax=Mycobacteroides abscessus TaxID=36809 RepID=UPI0009A761ED|nr:SIR2 family protein [Mycobacteroides abscessus]SLH43962.1 Uncharacterised protein [Mycobacteroides abscessus subsp. massiliense]